ncbi:MAG: glycine--tRNA ligase [Candidatus Pacearchaeota archaeon]|nr:glycine--tRNA ligase [Candidatus Pacearchaeota archaeon]
MAFIVKKKINEKDYYYLNENKRVNGKVKTKTLAYLGKDKKEAEKKAKEVIRENKQTVEKKKAEAEKTDEKKIKISSQLQTTEISIEELAAFCKRKGFVYQSAEIYGGLAGFWDFGNLGTELKNNIKKEWWKYHIFQREDIVGIDGAIITNPKVWEASGHVENFVDVAVVNKKTKEKFKVDKFEAEKYQNDPKFEVKGEFNPMFATNVGPIASDSIKSYLRPETAQLIFANFKTVYENARLKLPCGIAQAGKAFRNEIAPRDFLFRSREFEQMEIEYFIKKDMKCPYKIPDAEVLVYSAESQEKNKEPVNMKISEAFEKKIIKKDWHAYWLAVELKWFKELGANIKNFRIRQHSKNELSHYSTDTWDLEYKFPFGWKELEGIADRGNYDLSQHEKFSGKDMKIFDEESKEKIIPEVICEPSLGIERAFLVFMLDSYCYDKERENIVLKLHPKLAPIKAAVFPIVKGPKFEKIAEQIVRNLRQEFNIIYDKSGSIGRRYSRNDEVGTPFCITIDGDSLKNKDVTIRDRDTKKQIRVKTEELTGILRELIEKRIKFEKAGKLFS